MKKFVLVDGYVSMDNVNIKIEVDEFKNVKTQLILFLVFVSYTYDKFKEYQSGKFPIDVNDYFKVGLIFLAFVLVFFSIYGFLFKKNFKKQIIINEIKAIESCKDFDNENIIELDITRDNGRVQTLKFRKLEHQLEPFIEELKKRNTRIITKNS